MSTISEILDRLSGISAVKERLTETAKAVERSLAWLLDLEKRLIRLEERSTSAASRDAGVSTVPARKRLPRKSSGAA